MHTPSLPPPGQFSVSSDVCCEIISLSAICPAYHPARVCVCVWGGGGGRGLAGYSVSSHQRLLWLVSYVSSPQRLLGRGLAGYVSSPQRLSGRLYGIVPAGESGPLRCRSQFWSSSVCASRHRSCAFSLLTPPPPPLFPPPSPSHAPPLLNPPFLLSVHQPWKFLRTGRAPRASDVQGGHLLRPQVLTATASSVSHSVGPLNQGRQALTDWGSGEQTIAPLSASAGYVLGSERGKKERKKERD